jgi:hypothetical protein
MASMTNCRATAQVKIIGAGMTPDWNHDRKIDDADHGQATVSNPYRFWVNDDADKGDVANSDSDLPGRPPWPGSALGWIANYSQDHVCGRNDLEDYFPVWLDLHDVFAFYPPGGTVEYRLKLDDSPVKVKAVYTDLTRDHAGDYLTTEGTAYGPSFNQNVCTASVFEVTASGVALPLSFLNKIVSDEKKGVLLLEGAGATIKSLTLEVRSSGTKVCEGRLPLSISPVEDMFRYANLRPFAGGSGGGVSHYMSQPPNNPDSACNNKNVVFIHGFNESPNAAMGNICEVFKRLYWSGSRAKFTGVQWNGDTGTPPTTHFHWDVTNAFVTADYFEHLLNFLAPAGEVNVIAFSLGNMVVSSAIQDHGAHPTRYFMLHAAVAKEVYDGTEYDQPATGTSDANNLMEQAKWRAYPHHLYASEWYHLWDSLPTDGRHSLTWTGRCSAAVGPQTYNFYSSGDEILDNLYDGCIDLFAVLRCVQQFGRYSWCGQELLKGRAPDYAGGSTYGGWGFNLADYATNNAMAMMVPWDPVKASTIPPAQLKVLPFFNDDGSWLDPLFQEPNNPSGVGSLFAQANRNRLLAEMIPAISFATGRNSMSVFTTPTGDNNFDMNVRYVQSGRWPASRLSTSAADSWLHGDYRYVAYPYVYGLFDKISKDLGGFDQ